MLYVQGLLQTLRHAWQTVFFKNSTNSNESEKNVGISPAPLPRVSASHDQQNPTLSDQ